MTKIKGITLDLGGTAYVVPPLSLGALESMQDKISAFTGGLGDASVSTCIDCLHAALRRNYPDMTRDQVAEILDVGNMAEVMTAVMDVSGMRRRSIEEAEAGKTPALSSGAESTLASSPTPGIPQT